MLILGGTAEANQLAERLAIERPHWQPILSLAGRTRAPALPPNIAVRIGGFGGAHGLADYLQSEAIDVLIDATHPFAATISGNAASACVTTGTRQLTLLRPPWRRQVGDDWVSVPSLQAACDALPMGSRPFLALGRQHLAPFLARSDLGPLVRMIDPPATALPVGMRLILAKPSVDWRDEADLMRSHAVDCLVCRNAGGAASYAKIEAARGLGLRVVMIERPPAVQAETFDSVERLLDAL